MERKPDISIVIVNYNVKDFLFQCLKSIEAGKSRFVVQTIVVDNNSEDGSMDYLIPLFPDVEFIPLKDNIGFGRANNLGFDIANGKYILILNPDTIISNDTLDVMWEYMERDTKCGIAGCKVLNADGTFQLACRRGFPTPWASFSKLFGLQKLFPKSKLFAEYNQTFRSIDETYYIDAVIGAFMFARKEAIDQAKGFDPTFFMYGEDIDLCYRVNQNGWSIAYVHNTSIVHYKGESTRRSSINEVKHFYEAMEIFVEKHYGKSHLFLGFLKTGIVLRSIVARLSKFKRDFFFIISDVLISNLALLASTKIRFKDFFAFPDYAYPTVFIAISIVVFISLFGVGEYFEEKQTGRKAIFGLMISFFFLSSLTYFFPEYGFSRGVLLMSIGFASVFCVLLRGVIGLATKYGGKGKAKRVLIVGINPESKEIIKSIQSSPTGNIIMAGAVSIDSSSVSEIEGIPVVGTLSYLSKLITDLKIDEVIMTDKSIKSDKLINILISNADSRVRFHSVIEYDDLLAAKIIDGIAGIEPTVTKYNLSIFRNRIAKRFLDISVSALMLTIGLPFIALFPGSIGTTLNNFVKVFSGKMSFIGLYPTENMRADLSKIGITGLAHISNPSNLTEEAIKKLNDYYIKHYSLLLDLDILVKYVFRK